jgi:hypothetical protein
MKSYRLAGARRTRSCQGGSLDQGESVGGGWQEGGSPRRAVDGSEVCGGVDSRVGEQHGMTGKLAICLVPLEEVGG